MNPPTFQQFGRANALFLAGFEGFRTGGAIGVPRSGHKIFRRFQNDLADGRCKDSNAWLLTVITNGTCAPNPVRV
jgi:hypothetical protein